MFCDMNPKKGNTRLAVMSGSTAIAPSQICALCVDTRHDGPSAGTA